MLERFYSLTTKYPLDVITYFSILLPIIVGLVKFRYLKRDMKLVFLFFLVDFLVESAAMVSVLQGFTTLYQPDIRASLNIVTVAAIYNEGLVRAGQKKIIAVLGVVFFLFSVCLYSGDSVAPWSSTAFRVFAMGATLTYYTAILSDMNLKKIYHHSMFWFTAGLLIYTGGTLFTMLSNEYLYDETTPDRVFDLYYNLMQGLYIVLCLATIIGFRMSKQDRDNYFERNYLEDKFF